jgi:hypothetical protein
MCLACVFTIQPNKYFPYIYSDFPFSKGIFEAL